MGVDVKLTYRLYQALMRVTPELASVDRTCTVRVAGGLLLRCDVLEVGKDFRRIALGHYWMLATGDQVPDVIFEICVFFDWELAEAVSYHFGGRVDDAYPIDGEPPVLSIHRRINRLLERWLLLLAQQGYCMGSTALPVLGSP